MFRLFLVFVVMLSPRWALAEITATECEQQFEKLLLTSVDCSLEVRPDSLEQIVSFTSGALKDAACVIPLKFEKSEVYGKWISKDLIDLPKLQVQCHLLGLNQETYSVTTYIQPACSRIKEQEWGCSINMSGTAGLGVLGPLLEAQVNESNALKSEMRNFLISM